MGVLRKYFPKGLGHVDYWLLGIIIALLTFGMLMLFSASFYYGQSNYGDGYYYVFQQARGMVLGGILMFIMARLDYRQLNRPGVLKLIYAIAIIFLILCFIPGVGVTVRDAKRWFRFLGQTFQASEFSKFALVIVEAGFISRFQSGTIQSLKKGVLLPIVLAAPIILLVYIQPNFSMMTIMAMTLFFILFFAGIRWKHIVSFGVPALAVGAAMMMSSGYRRRRVLYFLEPFATENLDKTYQLRQSLYAIGSGGMFGTGIGQSRQKYSFLPFGESDFIFSIIAEEIGFFGCVILMLAFLFLVWRGFNAAWRCKNTFGRLTAAGITTLIGLQTFVCIAVATGSMPTTGVPLPLISFGSSSLMCTMAALGLLLSISRTQAPEKR